MFALEVLFADRDSCCVLVVGGGSALGARRYLAVTVLFLHRRSPDSNRERVSPPALKAGAIPGYATAALLLLAVACLKAFMVSGSVLIKVRMIY